MLREAPPEGQQQVERVRAAVAAGAEDFVADLVQWLRIPSVSGDPEHHADVRHSAEHLAEALRRTGFPTAQVWETGADSPGLPAVFAEWPSDDPGAPTVVVYGHHDVQPVTPLDLWAHPPFEPTVVGKRLHARGSSRPCAPACAA